MRRLGRYEGNLVFDWVHYNQLFDVSRSSVPFRLITLFDKTFRHIAQVLDGKARNPALVDFKVRHRAKIQLTGAAYCPNPVLLQVGIWRPHFHQAEIAQVETAQ